MKRVVKTAIAVTFAGAVVACAAPAFAAAGAVGPSSHRSVQESGPGGGAFGSRLDGVAGDQGPVVLYSQAQPSPMPYPRPGPTQQPRQEPERQTSGIARLLQSVLGDIGARIAR